VGVGPEPPQGEVQAALIGRAGVEPDPGHVVYVVLWLISA
jgi:hypothetical protein